MDSLYHEGDIVTVRCDISSKTLYKSESVNGFSPIQGPVVIKAMEIMAGEEAVIDRVEEEWNYIKYYITPMRNDPKLAESEGCYWFASCFEPGKAIEISIEDWNNLF